MKRKISFNELELSNSIFEVIKKNKDKPVIDIIQYKYQNSLLKLSLLNINYINILKYIMSIYVKNEEYLKASEIKKIIDQEFLINQK